jgi:cysteinyl-tRNA synthetase
LTKNWGYSGNGARIAALSPTISSSSMVIQRLEQTPKQLSLTIKPRWRWLFRGMALPLLIPGLLLLIPVADQIQLQCDRPTGNCTVSQIKLFGKQTETFAIADWESVKRHPRSLLVRLKDRDILIWQDRNRLTADLGPLAKTLQQFLSTPTQQTLTLRHRNIPDALLPAIAMIGLGGYLLIWLGRSGRVVIQRPHYSWQFLHTFGLPFWWRRRSLTGLESITVEEMRSPLGRRMYELRLGLTSGKFIALTDTPHLRQAHEWAITLEEYWLQTPPPPPIVQPVAPTVEETTAAETTAAASPMAIAQPPTEEHGESQPEAIATLLETPEAPPELGTVLETGLETDLEQPHEPASIEPASIGPASIEPAAITQVSVPDSIVNSLDFVTPSMSEPMTLTLYNSLTRQKQPLTPLEPDKVRMYCCGVTVYDYCHLGHARSYIVWDVVRRYLMWRGYQVHYVQNFTDIDDKILRRAREQNSTMEVISETYIAAYFEDMDRLNILRANDYPRATHTLDGIKRLIHELEAKDMAYTVDGDVYYSVRKFADYGKLSGRQLDQMQAGASGRVEAEDLDAAKKHDPFDFALWKAAKPEEPSWDSDWGPGRPGWHIECSAMVRDRFGDQIDLHVGGADLVFPHHENEIAQSEAATGQSLAQVWMHNGMVNVGGEKMSKSLGNFTTIRKLLDNPLPCLENQLFSPMALRLFVLQAQYRKPVDFTEDAIAAAHHSWQTLQDGLGFAAYHGAALGWTEAAQTEAIAKLATCPEGELPVPVFRFSQAMDDDMNTPEALAVLFELAKGLRRDGNLLIHGSQPERDSSALMQDWGMLVALAKVLGLEWTPAQKDADASDPGLTPESIQALIDQRQAARQSKQFAEADRIRDELKAQGVVLIDQAGGKTDWHRES